MTAAAQSRSVRKLEQVLGAWNTRLRVLHSVIWAPRGLAIGLVLGLILAVAARVWPLVPKSTLIPLIIILALIGLVAALIAVWVWQRSTLDLARIFDRTFGLKERMSTAVELATGRLPVESEGLADRQYHQTLRVASRVHPGEHLPLRANWREWAALLVPIAGLALVLWLPNPQDQVIAQQQEIEEAIDRELEELRELREEVLTNEELNPEEQQAIVEALDEAIETLEQPGVTQEEAVAALEAAEQELRDLSGEAAREQQQALEEASDALSSSEAAQEAAEALAQGDAEAAAEALDNIDADSLTPEEQQALAEALEQAAEALEGTNPGAAQAMQEAADALRSGDAAAAEVALGEAAGEMAESGSGGEGEGEPNTQQVEEYADQVGKGQSDVAGAGRGQGSQPGQSGMGQTQPQSGQGPGEGQQEGQQPGGGGSGRGEGTGEAQGGPEQDMGTDNGPGDGGETIYDDVYSPQRIGGEGGPEVDVPGDPGAGVPTGAEGEFAENPTGDATVPYNEVYGDYEGAVNEALDTGYVPLSLRDLIQQYFSRLDPSDSD